MQALYHSWLGVLLFFLLSSNLTARETGADARLRTYQLVGMIHHNKTGEDLQDLAVIRHLSSQRTYIVLSGERLPGMEQYLVHSLSTQGVWLTKSEDQIQFLLTYSGESSQPTIEYPSAMNSLDQLSGLSQDYIIDPEEILARTEDYFDHSETWNNEQGVTNRVTERRAVVTIEEYDVELTQKPRKPLIGGGNLPPRVDKNLQSCDGEVCPQEYVDPSSRHEND